MDRKKCDIMKWTQTNPKSQEELLCQSKKELKNMQLLLDKIKYTSKPPKDDITKISTRIVNCITEVHNLYDIAVEIGEKGRTWCPAIFNGSRSNKNFKEIQFIALDFDDGSDFNSVMDTAKEYMLPIIFAYETFSSVSCNRFRIVFKLETAITDINVFNIIIAMLKYSCIIMMFTEKY